MLDKKAADMLSLSEKSADYKLLRDKADLVILFGGDGTFLHTAHHFQGTDIPLLGVNLGSLGFMTEIEINEIEDTLIKMINNRYEVEERMMLEVVVERNGYEVFHSHALNDVVVNRDANAHLTNIKLFVRNEFIHSYNGDGLIIATPTGSTAYSLSAGGPIINSQMRAILITPICPHSLSIRPMIVDASENIKIEVYGDESKMKIASDGRYDYNLSNGDLIKIKSSQKTVSLVKLPDKNFYKILREKM